MVLAIEPRPMPSPKGSLHRKDKEASTRVGLETHTPNNLAVSSTLLVHQEKVFPPFVGRLPEFQGSWIEEPIPLELPHVRVLTNKINLLKECGLTGVCVTVHWLARQVAPLKKQVHPSW
jgi:hypothetical protein